MFIRFIAPEDTDNPWNATGVIAATRELSETRPLEPYYVALMQSTFDWLNEHLPCPPFQEMLSRFIWSSDAVAWFLPTAKEPISRMWDLVAILKQHDVPVQIIRSRNPGKIVYRDAFQVIAETPPVKWRSPLRGHLFPCRLKLL